MTVLPNLPESIHKRLDLLINNFLWQGRKAKIPLEILKLSRKMGGLNLTNLRLREMALKITWIQILETDQKMKDIVDENIGSVLQDWIWKCNLAPNHVKFLNIKSIFWTNVMEMWAHVNYNETCDANVNKDVFLWYNSKILIENKPFLWVKQLQNNLVWLSQLYEDGHLISIGKAWQKYKLSFINFHALCQAVPIGYKKRIVQGVIVMTGWTNPILRSLRMKPCS